MFVFEKSFQQIWHELTKTGWTYKKSTGLCNDQRYVPPGGSAKGTEGVDLFVRVAFICPGTKPTGVAGEHDGSGCRSNIQSLLVRRQRPRRL
ncbi:hypothetical protein PF011_g24317 [Phytophthora fragariae]|uniref:Uncharacterized protein n=1 Tax=Phytophthora fragariae TaxID=53985 RepID=A0A6A3I6D7_9STRA|nr:hypothetical protein PF011_g24317 [Phytophthora fragariae]